MVVTTRNAARSLLSLALLAACAPVSELTQARQGISGGEDDTVHTNVVGMTIFTSEGVASCTGSLIAPNLVLTARHCVSPVDATGILCSDATISGVARTATQTQAAFNANVFYVTTDQQIGVRSAYTRVAEVVVPPDSTNVRFCGRDIALLRLATPITSVPLIRPRLDLAPRTMETFTASGYGATNAAGAGSGRRRMRDGLSVVYVGRAVTRGITVMEESEWLADTGTCHGDSGGPAIDQLGEVFGVLSRGANNCDSPIYTRVDSYSEWIRAQAARAAMLGGYTAPTWVTPPTPAEGEVGTACSSDAQCDTALSCMPTGRARECTVTDCASCPDGWICDETGTHCIHDPAAAPPPPPADASTPDAATADASDDAAVDTGAADAAPRPTTPSTGAASGSCNAGRVGSSGGVPAWAFALLGLALVRRRAR